MNVFRQDTAPSRATMLGNLTNQDDTKSIYRKRRMPKRKRRQLKNFMRKLKWGMDKMNGMKTCVINHTSDHTQTPISPANGQIAWGVTIYGYGNNSYAGNSNFGNGDVWWIFARENGGDPSASAATRKLRFRSCVMDLNLINQLDPEAENAQGGAVIIDCYHVMCTQSGDDDTGTHAGDPSVIWSNAIAELNGTALPTGIGNNQWDGVTPFDSPTFARYFNIKGIRRYRLNNQGFVNMQMRDPGNYVLNMDELLECDYKRYVTEGYIFVASNPGCEDGVRGDVDVQCNYNKKYHYTETLSSQSYIGGEDS